MGLRPTVKSLPWLRIRKSRALTHAHSQCSDLASARISVVYSHAQNDESVGECARHPEVGVWRAQKLRYDALLRTRPRFLPSLTCPLQIYYIECFLSTTILQSFYFDSSSGIACKLFIVQVYNYSTDNLITIQKTANHR